MERNFVFLAKKNLVGDQAMKRSFLVIDSDGHILETDHELREYLPAEFRAVPPAKFAAAGFMPWSTAGCMEIEFAIVSSSSI